jgi:hypothetical protein
MLDVPKKAKKEVQKDIRVLYRCEEEIVFFILSVCLMAKIMYKVATKESQKE